jgi:GNAT superfamily N-acetyltransferase
MEIVVRDAIKADMPAVHQLIGELALYEKAPHEFTLSLEQLMEDGFGKDPVFECLVAEINDVVVGMALFYTKYSTWKGKCIYLDDIVVKETHRRFGVGTKLFQRLRALAKARHAQRLEWQVLDWNEPAIQFYKKLGAELDSEWINAKFRWENL